MYYLCYDVEVDPSNQFLEGQKFYNKPNSRNPFAFNNWRPKFSRPFFYVKLFNPLDPFNPKEAKEKTL